MIYEKPQLIDSGMSEGVYTASGGCDCFTYIITGENRSAGFYSGTFKIIPSDSRTHMTDGYWDSSMKAEVTFNQAIPANCTIQGGNEEVNGNKVTIYINHIIPAYDENCSWHNISVNGAGAENLSIESIEIKHI
jgi:hypothetical protein